MEKQNVFTKAGQVAPAYREPLRAKVIADLEQQGWQLQHNGQLTKELFTHQGVVVRAVVDMSISTRTNFIRKVTKSVSEKPVIDINELLKQG